MSQKSGLFRQFSFSVILSFASKIVSFITTLLLLSTFGTSKDLDIFLSMSSFIIMINMIINKVYINAIPIIYLDIKNDGERSFLINSFIQITILLSLIVFLFFVALSPVIVKFIAPGFDSNSIEKSIFIFRLFSISLICNILSSVLIAYFRSVEISTPIYVKDVIVNSIVLLFLFFSKSQIEVVAIYYLIGYLTAFIYLSLLYMNSNKVILHFDWNRSQKYFREFIIISAPIFLSTGANEIKNIVDKIFASFLDSGSISALNFSYRIIGLPVNILGGVFVTIIFSKLIAASKYKDYVNTVSFFSRMLLVITIPMSIFVFMQANIISSVFSALNSNIQYELLFLTVKAYSFCIFGNALLLLMNTVYYAQGKTKIALKISVILTFLNVLLNAMLVTPLGISGISYSTTIASILTYFVSLILFDKTNKCSLSSTVLRKILLVIMMTIPSMVFLWLQVELCFTSNNVVNNVIELFLNGLIFVIINYLSYIVINKLTRGRLKIVK